MTSTTSADKACIVLIQDAEIFGDVVSECVDSAHLGRRQ